MTYPIYRLTLPSGGVVRARKASVTARVASGAFGLPLLSAAVSAVADDDNHDNDSPNSGTKLDTLLQLCRICLADRDIDPTDLTLVDQLALCQWGCTPGVVEPAIPDGEGTWDSADFLGLVRSSHALILDAASERYGTRPSVLLGIEGDVAVDLDLAIAVRGLRHSSDGSAGDVEVEDVMGEKHTVPSTWLSGADQRSGGRVTHMDTYAKLYGPSAWSAGGGCGTVDPRAGRIGPMPKGA